MSWLTSSNGLFDITKQVIPIILQRSTYKSYTEMFLAPVIFVVAVRKLMQLQGWK